MNKIGTNAVVKEIRNIRYKSMVKIGPEISGVKRCQNIPVFSRRDSSEIKAYVKCYEFSTPDN